MTRTLELKSNKFDHGRQKPASSFINDGREGRGKGTKTRKDTEDESEWGLSTLGGRTDTIVTALNIPGPKVLIASSLNSFEGSVAISRYIYMGICEPR
jgi:hypothetical protein